MSVAIDLLKTATLKRGGGLALVPSTQLEALSHPQERDGAEPLPLACPELEAALPDRGLPRGVVELTTAGLGGATQVALAAVRGGQGRGVGAWCAWLDPEGSLYAPGVAKAGVDLGRLLVVRPPRKDLGQVAVKLARSRAFEVIVIDHAPALHTRARASVSVGVGVGREGARPRRRQIRPEILVRKLALLAEESGSTVILLTDSTEPRPLPWPVALRLELSRGRDTLSVRVAKDRFCRLGSSGGGGVKVSWPLALAASLTA